MPTTRLPIESLSRQNFFEDPNPATDCREDDWAAPSGSWQVKNNPVCITINDKWTCHAKMVFVIDDIREYTESEEQRESELQREFNERADRWEIESAIHSSPGSKFLHKDFIWIITRGPQIVPHILERLNQSQSDWFWALENITQENPAKNADSFESAVRMWQEWASEGLSKK